MTDEIKQLDEAIVHCLEIVKSCRLKACDIEKDDYMDLKDCAAEHEQLAAWLTELKKYKEQDR